ncbi:hypothetical protein CONLIGDRAFT_620436 [Coniochaeta ligniaria NRRL 30616]|uniref:Polynucleotide 5'-hydroxyl-kinase GRC3 n=1 Tax=Coniochaeta ligniaria NRRL 30616 TaxID=1408157 RepID=A0A1J7JBH5_9PEZI|nr:hypothetical protein CONLIGDRAFT_620436 [Coniochaeta ligniaria NRRL 30616]
MSSVKKRKIGSETGAGPPVSAFAARQKLWGTKPKEAAPVEPTEEEQGEAPGAQDGLPNRPASTRKRKPLRQEDQPPSSNVAPSAERPSGSRIQQGASLPELSSDSVQDAISSQLEADATRRNVLHHSSFRPNSKNYHRRPNGQVVIKLSEGERVVILGSYGLKVNEGEISVAGATIRRHDMVSWVNAPLCHAIPVIRTTRDTVLELRPSPAAASLRDLEKLNPVFGRLWNDPTAESGASWSSRNDTFRVIFTSEDGPKHTVLKELSSPGEWNKKLAQLTAPRQSKPPRILICGPKSSGKSTFSRMLANRFVTHHVAPREDAKDIPWNEVAYLDVDPGQPEFTVPGVISLVNMSKPNLAPSFCHPAVEAGFKVVNSQAVASVSPALDPEHLVECAIDMFKLHYKPDTAKAPLVINTPGWVQGTGLDIITTLIKHTDPTEIVYMSRDGPEETVEHLKSFCGSIPFTTLPSQASEYTSRTALHYRTMQTMSYFHIKPPSVAVKYHVWDPTPLTEIPPFKVRYRGANRGIFGLLCYDYQPHPSLLAESINGMIVALVVVEEAAFRYLLPEGSSEISDIAQVESAIVTQTPEGIPFIQNPNGKAIRPELSETIGLALIRGIDADRGELQVLTPLADSVLAKFSKDGSRKLVMVAGKFDTPSWAYTEDLYRKSYGNTQSGSQEVTVADEDTDEDASEGDHEEDVGPAAREYTETPWVEMLHGNQKRSVGSRVWRVRRDLGKG